MKGLTTEKHEKKKVLNKEPKDQEVACLIVGLEAEARFRL